MKSKTKSSAGQKRINNLSTIFWQAHHRKVNNLLSFVWDFANEHDGFYKPALTACFFSDELSISDWGKISGTKGRSTKVTSTISSGKAKLGKGWILLLDDEKYIERYSKIMKISKII